MSNEHVDYMLYELARAAIIARVSELSLELSTARESEQTDVVAELESQRLDLWIELHDVSSRSPRTCTSIVRKYSTDTVRAQRVLRELNKLRMP